VFSANQHALERLTDPGVEIAPDVKLKDLGTNELLLIHKFSVCQAAWLVCPAVVLLLIR
jgi:hypothetical protein